MTTSIIKSASAWEHLSESNEHFTPMRVIEPAQKTLGVIDLDPASCAEANARVGAKNIYTLSEPGHDKPWFGSVILNPPGGLCDEKFQRVIKKKGDVEGCVVTGACGLPPGHVHKGIDSSAKRWWFKLCVEWLAARVDSAIFVGFSLEMLQTMQVDTPLGPDSTPLPTPLDFPLCFPRTRVPYDKISSTGQITKGGSPPHASFIAYLPRRSPGGPQLFQSAFSGLGKVILPGVQVR